MATNNPENNINNSSSTSSINDTSQSSTLTTPSSGRYTNYSSINRTITTGIDEVYDFQLSVLKQHHCHLIDQISIEQYQVVLITVIHQN